MRWYVYSGGERLPRTGAVRGHWPGGYDVVCSCGWESRTGGGTRSYIRGRVWEHKMRSQRHR